MSKEYKVGTFCVDIKCPKHKDLEALQSDAYLEKKKALCKDCAGWIFFNWAKDHEWRIVHTVPQMSNKELAARIRGIDVVRVEDLTEDEILCL